MNEGLLLRHWSAGLNVRDGRKAAIGRPWSRSPRRGASTIRRHGFARTLGPGSSRPKDHERAFTGAAPDSDSANLPAAPVVFCFVTVKMVGVARIELATPAMSTQCSTTELHAHSGRACRGACPPAQGADRPTNPFQQGGGAGLRRDGLGHPRRDFLRLVRTPAGC